MLLSFFFTNMIFFLPEYIFWGSIFRFLFKTLTASEYDLGNWVWLSCRNNGDDVEGSDLCLFISAEPFSILLHVLNSSSFTLEAITSPILCVAEFNKTELMTELRESIISLSSVFWSIDILIFWTRKKSRSSSRRRVCIFNERANWSAKGPRGTVSWLVSIWIARWPG